MGWPGEKQRHSMSARGVDTKYYKGPYGYRIRIHRTPNPSDKLIGAMELFVDQLSLRKREWGLIENFKEGITNLAIHVAEEENLTGKDLQDFVSELKARKYGVNWKRFNQEITGELLGTKGLTLKSSGLQLQIGSEITIQNKGKGTVANQSGDYYKIRFRDGRIEWLRLEM